MIFAFFEPENCEVIQNFSKLPLNFSPLKCTYLGKKIFQYHKRSVRKMKLNVVTLNFVSVYVFNFTAAVFSIKKSNVKSTFIQQLTCQG